MSGGVDSSVAALLLARQGFDVVGFFLRNGVEAERSAGAARSCCSASDASDARLVADQLGVPFYALDAAVPFARIIDRFASEYARGRTPNPCVECNVLVKFGRLLDFAVALDATAVATGHYARVAQRGGRSVLGRAADAAKDQSYVLATLRQDQLARARFPLGDLTKSEVREMARAAGLPVADKPESQEICFVPGGDYRQLLAQRGVEARPGPVLAQDGEVLGTHGGVHAFTIGQRRGLGFAAGAPRYVSSIDAASGAVTVGTRADASARGFRVSAANWVAEAEPQPGSERRVLARIRHRHCGASAVARVAAPGALEVRFDQPEFAVTPGQMAVLYAGEDVLAAGPIDEVSREGAT